MSEDKDILEFIKKEYKHCKEKDNVLLLLYLEDTEKIINLIEKQQKEIEHWKAGMKIVERDKNNHIERLEKELDNIKEIEKSHQKENGKLRVELEKYKLLNANIEKANEIIKSNKLNEKEREIIETYRKLIEETGRNDWIICNPKTMWSNYFVKKDKIKEMKEFYINEHENKNITLIPLENIIKNINVLLEEK